VDTIQRALIVAASLILAGAVAAGGFEDPHGIGYDGRDWKAMSEQAKLAYVAGFLAGALAQQALDRHRLDPRVSVDAAVSEIAHAHSATFPLGSGVYKNVLDDYYFYRNNLPTKIYHALIERNTQMLKR
jgi:hypothetical protein